MALERAEIFSRERLSLWQKSPIKETVFYAKEPYKRDYTPRERAQRERCRVLSHTPSHTLSHSHTPSLTMAVERA